MNLQPFFDTLHTSIDNKDVEDQISILIYIANITQNNLEPLEVETLSKICSIIYINIYGNDYEAFKKILIAEVMEIKCYNIRICSRSLWKAVWCNSLKNFELLPSRYLKISSNNQKDFLLWCIKFILDNIVILDKNSLYLLRSLQVILNRKDLLSDTISYSIFKSMNKVASAPQPGFKQLACNVSKIVVKFLNPSQQSEICNIGNLPIKGIEIYEIVNTFSDDFIKKNLDNIVIKVLMMFSNNIENKDAGFLYEKILICTFEEWRKLVWPRFIDRLFEIEYEGEFFQSLVKYWIPRTINAYRTDFYAFMRQEPVDLRLKAYILLESRKKGFIFDQESCIYNHLETFDLGLSIISTYKKKSLCPDIEEVNFLMKYLYANLKNYLEDEEVASVKKLFSQIAIVANSDLKKTDKNFGFYADFVDKIYNYCYKSIKTDFFEVGAQILHNLLMILKGSHKDLKLSYKLEKKDYYENGENLLFIKLKQKELWKFGDHFFNQICDCLLRKDCCSLILTQLICQCYSEFSIVNPDLFQYILKKVEPFPNLQNTEKIINCSNLLFSKKSTEVLLFTEEIENILLKSFENTNQNEIDLFKKVLYLEILTCAKRQHFEVKNIDEIIKKSLFFMDHILESDFFQRISYKYKKVLETFITRVIFLISQNIQEIWLRLDKPFAINVLIKIIQKSNMKKPVSLSADLLRQFGHKLEENECDKKFKIQLLNETLEALKTPSNNYVKIRRNPESRLVIHALCISQYTVEKPFLHWTMNYLLNLISNTETTDLSMSSCLHTIELILSDNRLQQQTMRYIPDIIIQCVQLFNRRNWVVRNANLQLVKSLIERLYGVSMNNFYRPKNIGDLFILFPQMAPYFFKTLSLEELDDCAVIVFQFFSESYIKETVLNDDIYEILECFKVLFVHIIKNYENVYGKLAAKSYVSICLANDIPAVFMDAAEFIKTAFVNIPKNIFSNLVFFMSELYSKYKNSYENQIDEAGLQNMNMSWNDLTNILKPFYTKLFDYLLVKVKTVDDVFREKRYSDNLWVHNNLTFAFLNSNSNQICNLLEDQHFSKIPDFFHTKMLSILIKRNENNEFSNVELKNITNSLFDVAIFIKENSYLLNCYFKCLLILQKNVDVKFKYEPSVSKNIYKNMIILMHLVQKPLRISNDTFFILLLDNVKNNISINEDTDNDIISALSVSYTIFPEKYRLDILKIILYYSLLKSTYSEAFYFVSKFMNKSYNSILNAINDCFDVNNLRKNFKSEETLKSFFASVDTFINSNFKDTKCNEDFYILEEEILVPKEFVKKILKNKKCK